jgi:midasin
VTALKEGRWILLDEINLAPAETLERLTGILESPTGSVVLSERGDGAAVTRHPRFRVFGAMNPATDVGKRDLPAALKHRFTEVYAGECESREDLSLIVKAGLGTVPNAPIVAVVDFYLAARRAARETLLDSADQKPRYSLRTLSRAMEYARSAAPMYGVQRALYDGFAMAFKTLLKNESGEALEKLIVKHLLKGQAPKVRRWFGRSRTRGFVFFPRAPGVFFLTRVSLGSGSTPPARGAVTRRLVAVLIGVVDSIVGAHTYSPRDRASLKSARGP